MSVVVADDLRCCCCCPPKHSFLKLQRLLMNLKENPSIQPYNYNSNRNSPPSESTLCCGEHEIIVGSAELWMVEEKTKRNMWPKRAHTHELHIVVVMLPEYKQREEVHGRRGKNMWNCTMGYYISSRMEPISQSVCARALNTQQHRSTSSSVGEGFLEF